MSALVVAAWVWVSGYTNPTPIYFATKQACEAFREHRKTSFSRRDELGVGFCLQTGLGQ